MLAYNHAPFIAQAIEGVLKQRTSFVYDVVIGEDCSTDHTREIVLAYHKQYPSLIKVITSESNVGMRENSRRTGQECSGEFLAYCEGDDFWQRDDKLQMQVDILKADPAASLVCSDYDELHEATRKVIQRVNNRKRLNPSTHADIKHILRGTPSSGVLTCTAMVRSNLAREAGLLKERLHRNKPYPSGDTATWAALWTMGKFTYIDESLATYRRHGESATRSASKTKVLRTSIAMKEQILMLMDHYGVDETEKRLNRLDLWKRKLKLAFYENDRKSAQEAAALLSSLSPMERLMVFTSGNALLHAMALPIVNRLSRPLIPTIAKT